MRKLITIFLVAIVFGCVSFQPREGMTFAEFQNMSIGSVNGAPINISRQGDLAVYALPSSNRDLSQSNPIAKMLYDPNKDMVYIFSISTNKLVKIVPINQTNATIATAQEAQQRGFSSTAEYDYANAIGANSSQLAQLKNLGINSESDYRSAKLDQIKSQALYNNQSDVSSVIQFLIDSKSAKQLSISLQEAVKRRKIKEEQDRIQRQRDAEAAAAEQKRQLEIFAKEHPYEAVIKCGMGGNHINVMACFINDRLKTQLELTNGSAYRMYQGYELQGSVGTQTREGFIIPLKRSFSLKAQNAQETLILTVIVRDTVTKKVLYEKSAARFGVISIGN